MKITIDSEICRKGSLSFDDSLMLLLLKYNNNFEESIKTLFSKGYITRYGINSGPITLTQSGLDALQDILCSSENAGKLKRNLTDLASKMQQEFPTGKKDNFYWRGNTKDIVTKLQRFFALYGTKWTDEQIINATKHYVNTHSNDPYMRLLKYFILKDGCSDLAEILENSGQENNIQDWQVSIK